MPETLKGTIFLLALVASASMMPVEKLPAASWQTALGLGFISALFDNIPLTALALKQGGYDWGYLAYAVGFGGSMIWFGSSAGVALTNMYPEAKSVGQWLRHGWHVAVAYVVGFFFMLAVLGWHPDADHRETRVECPGSDDGSYRSSWANLIRGMGTVAGCLVVAAPSGRDEWVVLPVRIELRTSPLPRGCSTTELRQRRPACENPRWKAAANAGDPCHKAGNGASAWAPSAPVRTPSTDRSRRDLPRRAHSA